MSSRSGIRLLMVGDELLDGRVRESTSAWLVERLAARGVEVREIRILPDRVEALARALREALEDSGAVLMSGGLGPTPDDRSREALALVSGEPLELDESLLRAIRERFESRGWPMTPSNRQQAYRPRSAEPIANPRGTAPALWQRIGGVPVVLLPGVPTELRGLWEDGIEDRLVALLSEERTRPVRLRLGIYPESALADRVRELLADHPSVETAFCVGSFGVDVLLRGEDASEVACATGLLREGLAPHVYAQGDRSLHELLVEALAARGQTLAVAESCTGGRLGGALTAVPGSSRVFLGGVVAYANELKQQWLGVEPGLLEREGAVSEAVALAMAEGARARIGADWALSTTGIAGPGGGSEEKPVGTIWIGLAGDGLRRSRGLRLAGGREHNRRVTVAAALDLLRQVLELPVEGP